MKLYIIYDRNSGEILASGRHSDKTFAALFDNAEMIAGEIMEVTSLPNDVTEKVVFDSFDKTGHPSNPRIMKKEEVVSRIQKGGEDK